MPGRDLPARPTTPAGLMSSRPAATTPQKKKRPIEAAFARVTDSGAKRKARPRADRPAPRGLNFVDDDDAAAAAEPFVPRATHALLGYAVKGTKRLPEGQAALAAWVEAACDVPDDFEAQHKRGRRVGRRRRASETTAASRESRPRGTRDSRSKGGESDAPVQLASSEGTARRAARPTRSGSWTRTSTASSTAPPPTGARSGTSYSRATGARPPPFATRARPAQSSRFPPPSPHRAREPVPPRS